MLGIDSVTAEVHFENVPCGDLLSVVGLETAARQV